jgi:type IV secretion system protein VirD4
VDDQLVFVTGYPPMRTRKLRYYTDPTLMKRLLPPPEPMVRANGAGAPVAGDWQGERPKGAARPVPVAELLALDAGRSLDDEESVDERDDTPDVGNEADYGPDSRVTDV